MDQSDIYSSAARNLGVISDCELALNEQVTLLTLRLGRAVQFDRICLLTPPGLSFPLLFSLGLIIAMLSLLARIF